ncbi:serine/threonine-protein phosphatase PGAM5, mitochondrial-like isoform X2 [Watersipora subatra]|uniref:serine/threonine-protein phosphatase PGAM5, mitochondrial-like isoform X2 n=1 Tax=Watersipora subatra TaxID=2589382 RepID=UPI00355AD903
MVSVTASRAFTAGVIGGTALLIGGKWKEKQGLKASWTTNHNTPEPLYKWDNNWDKRQHIPGDGDSCDAAGDKGPGQPTAIRHILLIRHGQYILDGETDEKRVLTSLGKEQAAETGQRLNSFDFPITRVVCSTMSRAKETGSIISSHLPESVPVEYCSLLREGAPIPPEPMSSHWRPEAQFFQDGARIEAAFRRYIHRADVEQKETSYEVLVCHANVIRYIVCRALQLPPEAWLRMSLHNGSITWLTVRPSGNVSLRAVGDCGFMPIDKLTTT